MPTVVAVILCIKNRGMPCVCSVRSLKLDFGSWSAMRFLPIPQKMLVNMAGFMREHIGWHVPIFDWMLFGTVVPVLETCRTCKSVSEPLTKQ